MGISDLSYEIIDIFVHEQCNLDDFNSIGFRKYKDRDRNEHEIRPVTRQMNHDTYSKMRPNIQRTVLNCGKESMSLIICIA